MIYTNRNTLVKLNNKHIFTNKTELESSANISPIYIDGQRHTTEFANDNNVNSKIRLSYFLTGSDFIKNELANETTAISGFIGGIYFSSGYLSSYTVDIQPNAPIEASAEIIIFGCLTGVYIPTKSLFPTNANILNGSDIQFSNLSNSCPIGNVYSMSYSFNSDIIPIYYQETGTNKSNLSIDRVSFGQKTLSCELLTDSTTGFIPINGYTSAFSLLAYDKNSVLAETFSISGKAIAISHDFSNNNYQKLKVIQNRIESGPTISSFYPTTANPRDTINIIGNNFNNVVAINVNNEQVSSFQSISPTQISFTVDNYLNSGLIRVDCFEDSVYSNSNLAINYPTITVDSFSPNNLISGNSVLINGTNFNKISNVLFGDNSASSFQVLNENTINAIVPGRIANSYLSVISTSRNKSGISNLNYYAYPVIDYFTPTSGIQNTNVNIYGANFSGISSVKLNEIECSYSIVNTGNILVTVPTGDVLGNFSITNEANLSVLSKYGFSPLVTISGVSPRSGVALSSVKISGTNFYPYSLYEYENDGQAKYKVSFGNTVTGLYLINNSLLSGSIPKNAQSGPVYIYRKDGASLYNTTGEFLYINDPPKITVSSPSGIVSGDSLNMLLIGENLVNLTKVYAKGSGSTLGRTIVIWDATYNQLSPTANTTGTRYLNTSGQNDILGLAATFKHIPYYPISLSGNSMITGLAIKTGVYDLYVENAAGTGIVSGAFTINPLTNLARLSSTRVYSSSSGNGEGFTYGPYRLTDNNTGTLARTQSLPKQYFKFDFSSRCQIFDIQVNSTYVDFSTANTYLEISLITGVSSGNYTGIASSGVFQIGQYSSYTTGYPINTGTNSWRNEANSVLIRSHKLSAGVEQNYALALSEVSINGIKMNID